MPHDWVEDQPADYRPHAPSGRAKPPWWKCSKCGTRAESWLAPSGNMKVRVNSAVIGLVSCEEWIVWRIMES